MRNIILCGFMGCGKSTVGKCLAALTHRQFVDMDDYIVQQSGMTISEIFNQHGEAEFRRRERDACQTLAKKQGLIIAAGGGALIFQENTDTLTETGDIVLLDVPLDVILGRLSSDTSRPLLARPDKEAAAKELYERRLPLYRAAASITINANRDAASVAQSICRTLGIPE